VSRILGAAFSIESVEDLSLEDPSTNSLEDLN